MEPRSERLKVGDFHTGEYFPFSSQKSVSPFHSQECLKSKFKTNSNFHFVKYLHIHSTAEEELFEWSHHRILSIDSKVKTDLNVSITDSGSEMVKCLTK